MIKCNLHGANTIGLYHIVSKEQKRVIVYNWSSFNFLIIEVFAFSFFALFSI